VRKRKQAVAPTNAPITNIAMEPVLFTGHLPIPTYEEILEHFSWAM
jgi:hypothetical protein